LPPDEAYREGGNLYGTLEAISDEEAEELAAEVARVYELFTEASCYQEGFGL
jgi:hypothetical protein